MVYIVVTRSLDRVFVKRDGSRRAWGCMAEAQGFATAHNGLVRWEDGRIPLGRCKCARCAHRCPECDGFHDDGVMCA